MVVRYRSNDPEAVRQRIATAWRRLVPDMPFEGEYADQQLSNLYATDAARGQTFAGFSASASLRKVRINGRCRKAALIAAKILRQQLIANLKKRLA